MERTNVEHQSDRLDAWDKILNTKQWQIEQLRREHIKKIENNYNKR